MKDEKVFVVKALEETFRHRLARRVERAAAEKLFADDQREPRLMYFVQVRVNRACVYFHEHFIDAHVGVEPAAVRAPFATFAVNFQYVYRPSFVTERDDDVG